MVVDRGKGPKDGEMLRNHQTLNHLLWRDMCLSENTLGEYRNIFEITEQKRLIRLFMLGTALNSIPDFFQLLLKDIFVRVTFIIQPQRRENDAFVERCSRLIDN